MNRCEVTVMYFTDYFESSELSGAEEEENSLQADSHPRESLYRHNSNGFGIPPGSTCGLQKEQQPSPSGRQDCLPSVQIHEEVDNNEGERASFFYLL